MVPFSVLLNYVSYGEYLTIIFFSKPFTNFAIKFSDELEKHEDYFVNLTISLLSGYKVSIKYMMCMHRLQGKWIFCFQILNSFRWLIWVITERVGACDKPYQELCAESENFKWRVMDSIQWTSPTNISTTPVKDLLFLVWSLDDHTVNISTKKEIDLACHLWQIWYGI